MARLIAKKFHNLVSYLRNLDTNQAIKAGEDEILKPLRDTQKQVENLPILQVGKDLRDDFERVRDEPIPEKLKLLIDELKRQEKEFASRDKEMET